MKKIPFVILSVFLMTTVFSLKSSQAADETIRITCWEGYAKPFVDDFKKVIKWEYNIDVDVEIYNPTDQEEFYLAAKNETAHMISPPADLAKTPRFNCFEKDNYLLSPVDLNHVPNVKHMLPFFKEDQSLQHDGKPYGLPYNCGPYGLAYNADVVKGTPKTWNVFWIPEYAGNTPSIIIFINAMSGSLHWPWVIPMMTYSISKNWTEQKSKPS